MFEVDGNWGGGWWNFPVFGGFVRNLRGNSWLGKEHDDLRSWEGGSGRFTLDALADFKLSR